MDLDSFSSVLGRLLLMGLLLIASGFFSSCETSLFSLSRLSRERLSRSERSIDRYVAALLRQPRRLIVTILLGNELVNITFSALAAGLTERLVSGWSEVAAVLTSTALTVPLILLFGEVTPKSLALRVAESWARVCARPLGLFALVATPVRLVVTAVAGTVVRLLGGGASPPPPSVLGEAEFKALVDVGSAEGELEAAERRLIHNVFKFGDRTVAEIMTPARNVYSLSYELPLARLCAEVSRNAFSRIPIYRGRRENVVGIVFAKDLVGISTGRLQGRTVKDLLRVPTYVPKTTKCDRLFREFQRKKTHLAMVVDEYGRLVGLVTMEDLLEELFGEIRDEKERRPAAEPEGLATPLPDRGEPS
jgi:putative hemolysin